MFSRILVATDLTPATRVSLRAAFDLARHDQGEVLLVHVIRRIKGIPDRELREFYERLKADAKLKMHALTSWFTRERGVEIACEITIGHPAQEIIRLARDHGADLIVLAHAGKPNESPLGSVSYKVVQMAPCDVLMLKQATPTARRTRDRASSPPPRLARAPRTRVA
jgi:nucleotide-binding universal stress UspA family protein